VFVFLLLRVCARRLFFDFDVGFKDDDDDDDDDDDADDDDDDDTASET
jgi:hypothetical protein